VASDDDGEQVRAAAALVVGAATALCALAAGMDGWAVEAD
jgi:hypothetical protein